MLICINMAEKGIGLTEHALYSALIKKLNEAICCLVGIVSKETGAASVGN